MKPFSKWASALMHTTAVFATVVTIAVATTAFAAPVSGQVATASASATGVAGSYSALATGFAALGANPARLGLKSNPFFSLSVPSVSGGQGISPIGLSDVNQYAGELIPREQMVTWLDEISRIDGLRGSARVDASALALNVGPLAFQHSTFAVADTRLTPGAAELLMFGNSGLTGEAQDFALDGSNLDVSAYTSFALGYGLPISISPVGQLAVGASLTYTMGHALAMGRDMGSQLTSDPVAVDLEFPVIHSNADGGLSQGSGVGMDLGVAYETPVLSLGLTAKNVFNTFSWDAESLEYRPGEALFDGSESTSDFDSQPAMGAPAELLESLAGQTFDPILTASGAFRAGPGTTVVAELKQRTGDGIAVGPKSHMGVGVEQSFAGFFVFRAGAAKITDGYRMGTGGTVTLGPVNVTGAWMSQGGDVGAGNFASFGVSFNAR